MRPATSKNYQTLKFVTSKTSSYLSMAKGKRALSSVTNPNPLKKRTPPSSLPDMPMYVLCNSQIYSNNQIREGPQTFGEAMWSELETCLQRITSVYNKPGFQPPLLPESELAKMRCVNVLHSTLSCILNMEQIDAQSRTRRIDD
jgi:hypothetical protein